MKHRVCMVGRPAGWAKVATEEYTKRINGFAPCELVLIREGKSMEVDMSEKGKGMCKVCLDPLGQARSTQDWRTEWEQWERAGRTKIAWMIGGADGHSEGFRMSCDVVRSLGPQTLSHNLALVVLLEQIYRLESWRAGHPYHRV